MKKPLLTVLFAALLGSHAHAQGFTQVTVKNPSGTAKTDAVLTFGMVFRPGDVPAGKALSISGATFQVDAKAVHADGSLRHAVVSLLMGSVAANETKTLQLSAAAPASPGTALAAADVLKTDFDAAVTLTVGGTAYSASARDFLAAAKTWLSGPVCTEWLITAPLKNAAGAAHPHLHARFAVRAYQGLKSIRADVTVENDWAFEPAPSGFTYDAKIVVGKNTVFTQTALAHTHHARWRKVFWWGADPGLDYAYDRDYLFATGAFPYLDKSIQTAPAALSALKADFDPMSNGNFTSHMPNTGAHSDIGPLPDFASLFLLTQDARARVNVLANGNCGGSFQIHYRHKASDMPVSLDDFPYMTLLGNPSDAQNPTTGKSEAFPDVTNGLTVHDPDDAHQPSIAYLPYVISGDYYQLEELQFWANWNMVMANPVYREGKKGLLHWGQNRAQGWSMRTLGQAAYITPDAHPMKKYFVEKLGNNIDWYTTRYPQNSAANPMGYLEGQYQYEPYGLAPWMDDFFTWSVGYIVQMGFSQALPLALWKSKFVVGRMGAPGYCWLQASEYSLQIGTPAKVPFKTWAEIYLGNYPTLACTGLKMDGYPEDGTGYGANMQPALAIAVDVGAPGAKEAWDKYQTRSPKQDYTSQPEFAVVPHPPGTAVLPTAPRHGALPGSPRWFMSGTRLAYDLKSPSEVFLELFDTGGRRLSTARVGFKEKGFHEIDPMRDFFRKQGFESAPYLLKIRAEDGQGRPADLAIVSAR